jgi:hypothetical protein
MTIVKKDQAQMIPFEGFEADAGQGLENVTAADVLTPYLTLLQKGSPQVDVDSSERIEGAAAGMFFNNVTQEVLNKDGKGILVTPAFFEKIYTEWVDRAKGGGLKGYHLPDSEVVVKAIKDNNNSKIGKLITPEGTFLVESFRFFVVAVDLEAGSFFPAIMSFSSTQIKAAKGWLSKAKSMTLKKADGSAYLPSTYSRLWRLTSIAQQNDSGTWRGWKIDFERYINLQDPFENSIYNVSKKFFEHAKDGGVKIAEEPKDVTAESEAEF